MLFVHVLLPIQAGFYLSEVHLSCGRVEQATIQLERYDLMFRVFPSCTYREGQESDLRAIQSLSTSAVSALLLVPRT